MTISQRNNVIKLLPKSGIADLKAKEQARTVEEGLKLAKRVDGLRETYAKTEQDLEKYRTATLEAIGKEIGDLEEKKDTLTAEFRAMKSKYDSLMPEIATKRIELFQFEKSLRAWEKKLEKREEESGLAEIDVFEAKEKAETLLKSHEDNERISRHLVIQAKERESDAMKARANAREIEAKAQSDAKDMEAMFILRECSIKTEEKDILIKKTELMNERKQLEIEKLRVKDQRETLQRSLARLKAGRQA